MSRFAHHHPEDPEAAMERAIDNAEFQADCARDRQMAEGAPGSAAMGFAAWVVRHPPRTVYSLLVTSAIWRLLKGSPLPVDATGIEADQLQSNGLYCVHQMRVRLPDDPTVYRVIIAPSGAPITIGGVPVNQHFAEPMGGEGQ